MASSKESGQVEGVWCTRCRTKLLAAKEPIIRHFVNAHKKAPDEIELKSVLCRKSPDYPRKKKKGHRAPTGEYPDLDEIAEQEWRKYNVLVGTPGSGKKR